LSALFPDHAAEPSANAAFAAPVVPVWDWEMRFETEAFVEFSRSSSIVQRAIARASRDGFLRTLDGLFHRSQKPAAMIAKIPSANTVVSTMTPMISSLHGNKSRAIATNANMGSNASLDERTRGLPSGNVKLNCSGVNTVPSRFFRRKIAVVSF
jgi:hypothetical protein